MLNDFHASLKLEGKRRKEGRTVRIYGAARTPLTRVLESAEATPESKARLEAEARLGRLEACSAPLPRGAVPPLLGRPPRSLPSYAPRPHGGGEAGMRRISLGAVN